MERTEDGELNVGNPTIIEVNQPTERALEVADVTLSYVLISLLETLRGKVLVCCSRDNKKDWCDQCLGREEHINKIVTQIKAEMIPGIEAKNKFRSYQEDNIILRTFIDTNNPMGTADEVLRLAKMRIVK